jgi:hypothetical protein
MAGSSGLRIRLLQTLDSLLPSQENVVNNCGLVLDPPLKGLRKEGGTWNV